MKGLSVSERYTLDKNNSILRHGSGRYKYLAEKESYSDMLFWILNDGLKPEFDPLNEKIYESKLDESISLTRNRLYARIYSEQFSSIELKEVCYKREFLVFVFLLQIFYWYLKSGNAMSRMLYQWLKDNSFILKNKITNTINSNLHEAKKEKINKKLFDHWHNKSRKGNQNNPIINWMFNISDIENNYPILYALNKAEILVRNSWNLGLDKLEVRSYWVIKPENILFVEVPNKEIPRTENEISILWLDIPVYSMEETENYYKKKTNILDLFFNNSSIQSK